MLDNANISRHRADAARRGWPGLAARRLCLAWMLAAPLPQASGGDPETLRMTVTPAPRRPLRALSTDRPDKTETPFTVDAGHLQVEADLVRYIYDRESDADWERVVEEWGAGPVLLKLGVLPALDLEVGLEAYRQRSERVRQGGVEQTTTQSGVGDLVFRGKLNLWGNDGGATAMGLLPVVKLPTHQDGLGIHAIEGGLNVPFYLALPRDFELGLQTGWLCMAQDPNGGYHLEVVNSVALGRAFGPVVAGYVEFWTSLDWRRPDDWQGTFDFGVNFRVGESLKFDAGVNVGVTASAPDWNPFLGISARF